MVWILIAFSQNSMVTLMNLEETKLIFKEVKQTQIGRQKQTLNEARVTDVHTSLFLYRNLCQCSLYMLESACVAEISDWMSSSDTTEIDLAKGHQTRRSLSHLKNEALLVELERKVLVAAGERSWRDCQRVHAYTIWKQWRKIMVTKCWHILK